MQRGQVHVKDQVLERRDCRVVEGWRTLGGGKGVSLRWKGDG